MTIQLGQIAPDFEQDSTHGRIRFHDWLGSSWGVLFSHPKNFTPVCTTELGEVESRAPLVVENYRTRLTERLNKLLAEYDVRVEPADVVREVGLFAERSDISEEIVRLRSHLEQFAAFIEQAESNGRKL